MRRADRPGEPAPVELRRFLDSPTRRREALTFGELTGFLFVVAAAPEMIGPPDWIGVVFGGEEPSFADETQAQGVLGELMSLYNELNRQVLERDVRLPECLTFRDDPLSNLEEDAPASQWCRGFTRGHSWLGECWDVPLSEELEDELGVALLTLSFFASRRLAERLLVDGASDSASLEKLARTCRDMFLPAMQSYAQIGRSIHEATVVAPAPHRVAKVGRNEPCPCGSGKKHKKCCLGEPVASDPADEVVSPGPAGEESREPTMAPAPFNSVCQFKVTLEGIQPPIWRRIQVPSTYTFWDLHVAIQDSMGWRDYHLHAFRITDPSHGEELLIGIPDDDGFVDGPEFVAGWELPIVGHFGEPGDSAPYEYDFGDDWQHQVVLEEILPRERGTTYPRCLAGQRACPPEDCGGVPGYNDLLRVLADPTHDEHAQMSTWVGDSYDPEGFESAQVRFEDPEWRWRKAFVDD